MFNKKEKQVVKEVEKRVEKVEKVVEEPILTVEEPILTVKAPKEQGPVVAGNPDETVIDGKLYRAVGYMENGCSKSKLVEVK